MRSLSVLWLHTPDPRDAKILPIVEYGLSDAFRDFCHDVFNVRAPLEYPPLRLTALANSESLPSALFIDGDPRRGLSESGDDCCLFLVDDALFESYVEDLPLREWLRAYLPQIPRIVVTRPGRRPVAVPQRRWAKKPLEVLEHPAKHHERLVHLFKSFWMPRFWNVLRQYVQVKAGTNWHTPGHNGGRAFSNSPFLRGFYDSFGQTIFRTDLSVSVESLGDLSSPEARTPLSEAQ